MSSSEELSEKDIRCGVCFEGLFDPIALPCGHTLCRACAGQLRVVNAQKSCPFCRASIPGGFHRDAPVNRELAALASEALPEEARIFLDRARAPPTDLVFVYGNEHREIKPRPSRVAKGKINSHEWTMFVELAAHADGGGEEQLVVTDVVDRIQFDFGSHRSRKRPKYFPTTTVRSDSILREHERLARLRRTVNAGSPPRFAARRIGWGYFDVYVTIYLKNPDLPPVEFVHELDFFLEERGNELRRTEQRFTLSSERVASWLAEVRRAKKRQSRVRPTRPLYARRGAGPPIRR